MLAVTSGAPTSFHQLSMTRPAIAAVVPKSSRACVSYIRVVAKAYPYWPTDMPSSRSDTGAVQNGA